MFQHTYKNKRILITGHTGFKGTWLTQWLLKLGAEVTGLSLAPNTTPSLFEQLALDQHCRHIIGDIRDPHLVQNTIHETQPDYLFHLAAQPLVRLSYEIPLDTWNTNVIGTAHILEALRKLQKPCTAILITTDKCYENREWLHAYREDDALGGYDPYSASKAGAELVIHSYRRSYFKNSPVKIASARAGNVIGGGDWSKDRIVPDCIRALARQETIRVRNPHATRPWQHVLEPLSGYLCLAAKLHTLPPSQLEPYATFNFGPHTQSNRNVAQLASEILKHIPGQWIDDTDPQAPHEAGRLQLAIDKAYHLLHWYPVWNFETTIAVTARWYQAQITSKADPRTLTLQDIDAYTQAAQEAALPWAQP
jgi:CDP-glucose 4,6-dehydratase